MSVVQIAQRAGVSIATVSRVMNNSRRVNPAIAEQVRKAMAELNYSPKRSRRRSRSEKPETGTLAIVSVGQPYRGWFSVPVIAAVVAEIGRAAQERHFGTLITEMPDPEKLSPVLRRREVDGVLAFVAAHLDPAGLHLIQERLPVVRVMGGQLGPAEFDQVAPDQPAIGHLAADYLVEQGCRRLAFLTTNAGWEMIMLRGHGFSVGARRHGVMASTYMTDSDPLLANLYGKQVCSRQTLEALVDAIVADRPGGLFVSRDAETVLVHRLLVQRGIEPGRDITLVSCDNENVRLSMLHPRPASIELGTAEVGHWAVQRLWSRIRRPSDPPLRILVHPRLVLPSDSPSQNGQA